MFYRRTICSFHSSNSWSKNEEEKEQKRKDEKKKEEDTRECDLKNGSLCSRKSYDMYILLSWRNPPAMRDCLSRVVAQNFNFNPQSFVLTETMINLPQNNLTQVAIAIPRKGHTDFVHGPQVCQIDATKNILACKSCRLSLIIDNSLIKTQSTIFSIWRLLWRNRKVESTLDHHRYPGSRQDQISEETHSSRLQVLYKRWLLGCYI